MSERTHTSVTDWFFWKLPTIKCSRRNMHFTTDFDALPLGTIFMMDEEATITELILRIVDAAEKGGVVDKTAARRFLQAHIDLTEELNSLSRDDEIEASVANAEHDMGISHD